MGCRDLGALLGGSWDVVSRLIGNPRKLEHGFRRIGAGFPFSFV